LLWKTRRAIDERIEPILVTNNDFYLSANHTKSSQEANKTIEGIQQF
jgi:hypothetical protein